MARVVLTGAAGAIGTVLRPALLEAGHRVVLSDVAPVEDVREGEEAVPADLGDADAVAALLAGADAVVHMGGVPVERPMEELLVPNVLGPFHVLDGARRAGVRRVVLASSNHVTGFMPPDARLDGTEAARPDGLYGASKAWGEALGHVFADKWGLEVVCLRIGTFAARPPGPRALRTWLSHGDAQRLVLAALDGPVDGCVAVYGASANTQGWWDLGPARALGYEPRDDAEAYAGEIDGAFTDPAQGGDFLAPDAGGWAR